jgi:hypothetical protein
MTREELIDLARKIRNAEGNNEEEIDGNIDLFLSDVPNPQASDYFFCKKFEGMTLEEIVGKALNYRPIQL